MGLPVYPPEWPAGLGDRMALSARFTPDAADPSSRDAGAWPSDPSPVGLEGSSPSPGSSELSPVPGQAPKGARGPTGRMGSVQQLGVFTSPPTPTDSCLAHLLEVPTAVWRVQGSRLTLELMQLRLARQDDHLGSAGGKWKLWSWSPGLPGQQETLRGPLASSPCCSPSSLPGDHPRSCHNLSAAQAEAQNMSFTAPRPRFPEGLHGLCH